MNEKEYYLGFDMGTGSVGWAVTDTDYNLIKINRKYAWGSRMFDTSEGAEGRRINRCNRRRLDRKQERLELLRELFEEEIQKVDAGFFLRLAESRYIYEDKRTVEGDRPELPYSLFADADYTDKEYHTEFPTIYHLRKALMMEDRKFDVRLLYLAIAHILKNRGHFLANMGSGENGISFSEAFSELLNVWNSAMSEDEEKDKIVLDNDEIQQLDKIMKDATLSKTAKKQKLLEVLHNPSKRIGELTALITGGKITLSKLFERKEYDNLEVSKISFDDASYEEQEAVLGQNLGDDFELIAKAKALYDRVILSGILKGDESGYLSLAKVRDYEKHKKDLRILKEAIREDCTGTEEERKKLYRKVFWMPEKKGDNNYSAYVGAVSVAGRKRVLEEKKCINKDFCDFLKKNVLPSLAEGERKKYIEEQIEQGSFMPKARVKDNSVIPYQLHEKELKKILDNAEKYYPFLKEEDEDGNSMKDKIIMLLTFRIPYYVGPLNEKSKNAWVVRKPGRVTPWNFPKLVDEAESAKAFIEKMTSTCTYLKKEKVLPMSSLLYEKYMVLNEINNIKIYSEPISVELKQRIYDNIFKKHLRVTVKKILDYLKREEGYKDITKEDISGIDVEIKSSLKSYHAFKREFTDCDLDEKSKEDIIRDMTLFGAEPKLLKRRLAAKYPAYEKQLSALIKSYKCNAWGRLSEKLLSGIAVEIPGAGMAGTVIYQLWNTNQNLMQILERSDSPYAELIEKENGEEKVESICYQMVEDLYVAPATKRQIWQAVLLTEEIIRAMGHPPKRIFVEMAREQGEAKRSVTRKDRLIDLYKSVKEEKELFEQLKAEENDRLRSDKLYLYYTQLGKCAYTGKRIEIEDLFDNNLYDIDHIYPQSQTGDDSLDNRVLVYKPENADKSDIYPINIKIQDRMRSTWEMWYKKGLISAEKYKRLIRTTGLTDDELMGFINRQLVETRQSTKAFIGILKSILPEETEIVYAKAGNVSRFRKKYEILKVRELNDLHHAKDAFLNIVVGNVYHLKFTKDVRRYFIKNGTYRTYNIVKLFDYDVTYGNETAWKAGEGGTIGRVKKVMLCDKVLVTRQTYERKGELFDVQPLKKGKGQVALKSGAGNERLTNIEKYGGYNSATITYFSLIEGNDKKGKVCRYIAPVPLHLCKKLEGDKEYAREYFEGEFKLKDVKVIKQKILIQTLMVYEGFKMRLAGKMGTRILLNNANQLSLELPEQKLVKEIGKFQRDLLEKKDMEVKEKSELTNEILLKLYRVLCEKLNDTIYGNISVMNNCAQVIENGENLFEKLPTKQKVLQIYEILKLFQCTPEMPDLSQIEGSKTVGRIQISMNITGKENLAIIHQSVTGLYEQIERIGL